MNPKKNTSKFQTVNFGIIWCAHSITRREGRGRLRDLIITLGNTRKKKIYIYIYILGDLIITIGNIRTKREGK